MKKKKAEEPMRTMTKERKKEGPRLGHKGRADAKASRQLLLLCIPAIIAYILFNYIPMGAAVIIPFFFPSSWFAWVPPLLFSSFYEFGF